MIGLMSSEPHITNNTPQITMLLLFKCSFLTLNPTLHFYGTRVTLKPGSPL